MQNMGIWGGIILLVYAVVMFSQSLSLQYYTKFGPGPGFFPLWLSGGLIFLSLMFIWESFSKKPMLFKDILPRGRGLKNVLSVVSSVVLFMAIVRLTGYIVANILLMLIVLRDEYSWRAGLGIALSVTLVLFVVFQYILEVPLPVNIWGW